MLIDRRRLLAGVAALAAVLGLRPRGANAQVYFGLATAAPMLKEAFGARKLNEGKVYLKVPVVAENASSIQVTVGIPDVVPKRIYVVAPANPFPPVADIRFGPRAAKAEASLRIRLAKSQTVVAAAELEDGSVWVAQADITITSGACTELGE